MEKGLIQQFGARLGSMLAHNALFYANFIVWLAFLCHISISSMAIDWLLFHGAFACTAVAAYCFHDICDWEEDSKAGKRNLALAWGINACWALSLSMGSIGLFLGYLISWKIALGLAAIWAALIGYSAEPFRFKTTVYGFLLDALYAHTLPGLLVLMLINEYCFISFWHFLPLLASFSAIGIGDILSHQRIDCSSDKSLGLQTFAVAFPAATAKAIPLFDGFVWVFLAIQTWMGLDRLGIVLESDFMLLGTLLSVFFLSLAVVAYVSRDRSFAFRLYIPMASLFLLICTWNKWPTWSYIGLAHPYNLNVLQIALKKAGVYLFQMASKTTNHLLLYSGKLFGRDFQSQPLYTKEPRWVARIKKRLGI